MIDKNSKSFRADEYILDEQDYRFEAEFLFSGRYHRGHQKENTYDYYYHCYTIYMRLANQISMCTDQ